MVEGRPCAGCRLPLAPPVKRCSRCQHAFYCTRLCQKTHWPHHRLCCDSGELELRQLQQLQQQQQQPQPSHPSRVTASAAAPFAAMDLSTFSQRLEATGFVTMDGVSGGTGWAGRVAQEIEGLHASRLLVESFNKLTTQRGAGGESEGTVIPKKHIFELDLMLANQIVAPDALKLCPAITEFVDTHGPEIACRLNEACPALRLTGVDTVKVQLNEGQGGCFPMHYDTSSAISNRAVTALVYLNQQWAPGDGGELRLYPFPLAPADVQPVFDRMAIFCATETLHRVMPSNARRLVFSIWFASEDSEALCFPTRLPAEVSARAAVDPALAGLLPTLMPRPNRRLLAKVLYRQEYRESFLEAFGDNPTVRSALQVDEKETGRAAGLLSEEMAALLRDLPF